MSFRRLAAYSGIVFVLLLVVNIVLVGNQPPPTDPIDEIVDYLGQDTEAHKVAFVAGVALVPFFFIFLAGLVTLMRSTDREHDEGWAIVTLTGGLVLGAAATVGDALLGLLFYRGASGLDPAVVRAFYDGASIAYASTGVGIAALTGGVAAQSLIRHRGPAWYGWLSALAAALGMLTLVGIMSTSGGVNGLVFPSFPALLVWTLVTCVLMLRRPTASSSV